MCDCTESSRCVAQMSDQLRLNGWQTAVVATGLLPVRRAHALFVPWNTTLVEVATEYGYMALTCGNSASFYPMPCSVQQTDDPAHCLLVTFHQHGCPMLLQCMSADNAGEWIRVLQRAGCTQTTDTPPSKETDSKPHMPSSNTAHKSRISKSSAYVEEEEEEKPVRSAPSVHPQ